MRTYPSKRTRVVRWVSAAGLLATASVLGSACSSKELELVLRDLCEFRETASYAEFVVFESDCPNNTCGDVEFQLAQGNTQGAVYQSVVPNTQGLPEVGDLTARKYAFGAVLRDSSCKPIAYGCTCANLEDIKKVEINIAAWTNCPAEGECGRDEACTPLSAPGCIAPSVCVEGRCEGEPGDGGIPDASGDGGGGPCSLQVVASGDLPAPIAETATLSGPAVVATDTGFVIGYREQDPASSQMQAVLQGISDAGAAAAPSKLALSLCAATPTDGVGLAFGGTQGVMVTSLPDCTGSGAGAGASFITFDAAGAGSGPNNVSNPAFGQLTLARGHALAAIPGTTNDFELVYRVVNAAPPSVLLQSGTLEGPGFKNGSNTTNLFGSMTGGFGQVARTEMIRALLGQLPDRAAVVLQVGAPAGATEEIELPDATWGAVTAFSGRAAAIVPGTLGITYVLTDAAGTDLGTGQITGGGVRGGDIVSLGDRLLVLAGSSGSLTLHRFAGASTTLTPGESAPFTGSVGTASLADFEGDLVSMAAARGQVAITWLTRAQLAAGQSTGGWAILECEN